MKKEYITQKLVNTNFDRRCKYIFVVENLEEKNVIEKFLLSEYSHEKIFFSSSNKQISLKPNSLELCYKITSNFEYSIPSSRLVCSGYFKWNILWLWNSINSQLFILIKKRG